MAFECCIKGCVSPVIARGLCETHYAYNRRRGRASSSTSSECSFRGCNLDHFQAGFCGKHYDRARKNGGDPRGLILSCAKCGTQIIAGPGQNAQPNRNNYCSPECRKVGRDEARRKCDFEAHLKRKFNLTKSDYEGMVKDQQGMCAICGEAESSAYFKRLAVDHCHTSGAIRGLLCRKCNAGIGMMKENVRILLNAVKYLTQGVASAV